MQDAPRLPRAQLNAKSPPDQLGHLFAGPPRANRRLADDRQDFLNLRIGQSLRATVRRRFPQRGQPCFPIPPPPVGERPRRIAQKRGDGSIGETVSDQKDPMKPVRVSQFRGAPQFS